MAAKMKINDITNAEPRRQADQSYPRRNYGIAGTVCYINEGAMNEQHDPALSTHPLHIARQAALIGGASAIPGTVIGAFYGTLRTRTPYILGSPYIRPQPHWPPKLVEHHPWSTHPPRHDLNPTLSDKVRASTIAGAFTGLSLGFIFRGYRNVVPGTIMFALFGFAGQHGYNYLDARNSDELREQAKLQANGDDTPKENLMARFAKSKWSPMSVLSDEEYVDMMQEKLLKVEAEIAIIDDRIEGFRKKAREMDLQKEVQEVQDHDLGKK
ncbi:hypothetical protein N0V83_010463 [Neocucurbitaria cava]|uniref:Uncharacterized protein n=1 Tax=Neocucurbitaria cava TaxID=798079 RepID=A0A9W9CHF7_9PLEO|nr:hypothetical protein N0V83_010463 [Neocucurbitaria cava]